MTLAAIFSPEHGYAAASESENIASGTTKVNGKEVTLHSLYAGGIKGMRPSKKDKLRAAAAAAAVPDAGKGEGHGE